MAGLEQMIFPSGDVWMAAYIKDKSDFGIAHSPSAGVSRTSPIKRRRSCAMRCHSSARQYENITRALPRKKMLPLMNFGFGS